MKKAPGAGHGKQRASYFAEVVIKKLNSVCGKVEKWSAKMEVVRGFQNDTVFWKKWTNSDLGVTQLSQFIRNLKARHRPQLYHP